jgi:carbonic anhydrase
MAIAAEARNQVMPAGAGEPDEAAARACEQAAIRISLQNLLSFQWVKERVHAGRLNLHGWYFDMEHQLRANPSTVGFESRVIRQRANSARHAEVVNKTTGRWVRGHP